MARCLSAVACRIGFCGNSSIIYFWFLRELEHFEFIFAGTRASKQKELTRTPAIQLMTQLAPGKKVSFLGGLFVAHKLLGFQISNSYRTRHRFLRIERQNSFVPSKFFRTLAPRKFDVYANRLRDIQRYSHHNFSVSYRTRELFRNQQYTPPHTGTNSSDAIIIPFTLHIFFYSEKSIPLTVFLVEG